MMSMRIIAFIQFGYFAVTGLWPLIHIRSFLVVTGPKTDLWLVRTVGALITVIAAAVGIAAFQNDLRADTILLAIGSSLVLAAVDIVYVALGVISKVYLFDALAEILLILAWTLELALRNA